MPHALHYCPCEMSAVWKGSVSLLTDQAVIDALDHEKDFTDSGT